APAVVSPGVRIMRTPAPSRTSPFLSVTALLVLAATLSQGENPPRQAPSRAKELAGAVRQRIDAEYPSLDTLYKTLHAEPELSFQEVRTAARLAGELKKLGFDVTEKVGGHGVVGVFKNGPGPTVMIRTEMDALPVTEKTRLPYASTVRTRGADGLEVGVM